MSYCSTNIDKYARKIMPAILIKSIKSKKLKSRVYLTEIRRALNEEADIIKRMYARTVKTWNNKPLFVKEITLNQKKAELLVRLAKGRKASKIYEYIDLGTKVRYATMTPGFKPKTSHRVIGSRGGSGGVLIISKKRPRPGIKAREFSLEIRVRRRKGFFKTMNKAMKRAARKTF